MKDSNAPSPQIDAINLQPASSDQDYLTWRDSKVREAKERSFNKTERFKTLTEVRETMGLDTPTDS